MAPTKSRKASRTKPQPAPQEASASDGSAIEDGVASTPASQDMDMTKLAREMQKDIQSRRAARRKDIENEYRDNVKSIEKAMVAKFAEIESGVVKTYRVGAARLAEKLKRKAAIERNIEASLKRVHMAYAAIETDLRVVLKGKMKPLAAEEAG